MSIAHKVTLTAFGLILVVACSSDKSGSGDGNSEANESGGSGAKNGTSTTNGGKSSGTITNGGKSSGTAGAGATATNGTSTSSTGSTGAGSTSSTGSTGNGTGSTGSTASGGAGATGTGTSSGTGSTGSTADPALGGSGSTNDPPAGGTGSTADPAGGSGNTNDPAGGKGNTGDPAGGSGNTGDPAGGSGNTGDPAGGKGNTGDPAGGSGNTTDPPDDCVPPEMSKVNVIVFEDATPSGADSEGGMYVGGNFSTTGSYSIGAGSEANLTCADWSFIVDGNISGTAIVKVGQAAYGGELLGAIDSTCGAYDYPNPNGLKTAPVDFAALEKKFIGYSTAFKNYPATAGATATLQWGTLTFAGTGSSLYVFNITAAQLMGATSFVFNVEKTASVIINVSGTDLVWKNAGFTLPGGGKACKGSAGAETGCERILWNFYEAATIEITGIGVQGTILAPYATQSGAGGNVDGQVIVKYLTGGIEYHPYYFSGCLLLL